MNYLSSLRKFTKTPTARLALSYLAIIMLMSIGFSLIFYATSSHELGKQIPHHDPGHDQYFNSDSGFDAFFQQRIDEGRHELLLKLVNINILVLVGGSLLSYYLARRTLQPIEESTEAQTQFVSDASHELRTPLTALQTSNEVALRKNKITEKEARSILAQNIEDVVKLRILTDSLLSLARVGKNGFELSKTDLSDVVADSINSIIERASAKNIAVDDQVPKIFVMANRASLAQALTTILDNAIKYSPEKSTAHISASRGKKYAELNVRDEGIGIKAVHLPHIFDRFYRADESRSKQHDNGYGIGLSLAKKIIEQHNGSITAQSHPGKGSTFTIKLPV